MGYTLSGSCKRELETVHHHLRLLVVEALKVTTIPFLVYEGAGSTERHRAFLLGGVSSRPESRHKVSRITGVAHAIDLVPLVDDVMRWELGACCKVADAMRQAALAEDVPLHWGPCWPQLLTEIPGGVTDEIALAATSEGRGPLWVNPGHYELPRSHYL